MGITDTNGKTTTSFMLKYILKPSGRTYSTFGTVKNFVNSQVCPSKINTPDTLKQLTLSRDEFVN